VFQGQHLGDETAHVYSPQALVADEVLVVLHFYYNESLYYGHRDATTPDRDPPVTITRLVIATGYKRIDHRHRRNETYPIEPSSTT